MNCDFGIRRGEVMDIGEEAKGAGEDMFTRRDYRMVAGKSKTRTYALSSAVRIDCGFKGVLVVGGRCANGQRSKSDAYSRAPAIPCLRVIHISIPLVYNGRSTRSESFDHQSQMEGCVWDKQVYGTYLFD